MDALGRDEPQPQGYLWLEVANGDAYLAFGCGIRANRSTDQVTTWWFITSRRPGIDLHLVEGRVPVSREALRTAIEPDLAFGQRGTFSIKNGVSSTKNGSCRSSFDDDAFTRDFLRDLCGTRFSAVVIRPDCLQRAPSVRSS